MCAIRKRSFLLLLVGLTCPSSHAFQQTQPTSAFFPTISHHKITTATQEVTSAAVATTTTTMLKSSLNSNDETSESTLSFENAVRGGWQPPRGSFSGLKRRHHDGKMNTVRSTADTSGAIMPDGGLSPCIIKVVGVGGGGCNAVSFSNLCFVKIYTFWGYTMCMCLK